MSESSDPQPGARVRVVPAKWHGFGGRIGTVCFSRNGIIAVMLDGFARYGSMRFDAVDLELVTDDPVTPR
jgi:hypothetical protein